MGTVVLITPGTHHLAALSDLTYKSFIGKKMAEIDWESINAKLPFQRTDEEKAKRRELFNQFDPNGNGYLSLAETDKGMRDVLQSDELFDCKQAVNRAFHFAKTKSQGESKHGDDFLEFREFRLFLATLRQYFEYYQAFARIDTGDDNRVSKEEFTSDKIKASLEKWVGPIEDLEAEFEKIDTMLEARSCLLNLWIGHSKKTLILRM